MQQSFDVRRVLVGMVAVLALLAGAVSGWRGAAQEATQVPQPANPPVIVAEGSASLGNEELAWQVTRRETHISPNQTPEPFVPVGFVVADAQAVTLSVQGDGSNPEHVPAGDAGFRGRKRNGRLPQPRFRQRADFVLRGRRRMPAVD